MGSNISSSTLSSFYNRGKMPRTKLCERKSSSSLSKSRKSNIISARLIAMLITINVSFCVLSMPMAILQIVYYLGIFSSSSSISPMFVKSDNHQRNFTTTSSIIDDAQMQSSDYHSEFMIDLIDLLHAIAELLQYLNHGSNFVLYSLSGKTFRNETKRFFRTKIKICKEYIQYNECLRSLRRGRFSEKSVRL